MLTFSQNYFNAETKDGFFIDARMKHAWAAQLEVLEEIRRVCDILNIRFFADWGTLLGAVRHKGFIPWDDDLDIGMLRNDYMRFLELAPPLLSEYFELKSLYNDPGHDNVKARIITGRHMNFSKDYLKRFHGCPYVIGIDIFPIDYINNDIEALNEQLRLINLILSAASSIPECPPYSDNVLNVIHQLESMFNVSFDYNNRLVHELKKLLDMLSAICPPQNSNEVCSMIDLACGWDYHALLEWYSDTIDMPFENTTIPVPSGYDGILKIKYGDNYMTPVQCSSSHDYPFYKKQDNSLRETIEYEYNTQLSDSEFNQLINDKIAEAGITQW